MQKIKFNFSNSLLSLLKKKSKFKAFTLAEILLSLTVIGIVAAIALPSLLGNANERAWETQKKALYTRFSQALPLLPSLNGYGQLEEVKNGDDTEILDTAAETFVRDGLSKVMKITNICDNDHLTDCGLPNKIIPLNGGTAINLSDIKTLNEFKPRATYATDHNVATPHEILNTKVAGFETVNGESIFVYYNPNCQPNLNELEGTERYFVQPKMCANFVFDLNGKKGPNTVGKDIGFITVLYSTDPVVVAPNSIAFLDTAGNYPDSVSACKQIDNNMRITSPEEITSIFYNDKLIGDFPHKQFWTNSTSIINTQWTFSETGVIYASMSPNSTSENIKAYCIKR